MEIYVKKFIDEYGDEVYIFYESGCYSKPIMILAGGYTEKLLKRIQDEIQKEIKRR